MGPRPEDRGERLGIAGRITTAQDLVPSMGPQSEDRGEPIPAGPLDLPEAKHGMLQWGHGPKTVENGRITPALMRH